MIKHCGSSFSPEPEVGSPPLLLRTPWPPGEAAGQQLQQRQASPTSASCQGLLSTLTGTEMAENNKHENNRTEFTNFVHLCHYLCVAAEDGAKEVWNNLQEKKQAGGGLEAITWGGSWDAEILDVGTRGSMPKRSNLNCFQLV